jgi:hypothetical protein
MSLSIGLVKHQPIIPLNHSSSDMRSLTMSISPTDQSQDNERRRAIALKALNERWKALNADPTKSQLPKSFPQQQATPAAKPAHQHQGGFSHGHSHERKVIPKFNIDEIMKPIPMPAPPSMLTPSDVATSTGTKEASSSND